MIYINYSKTGEIIGAYHDSCENIPKPTIEMEDKEWNAVAGLSSKRVDLSSKKVVYDTAEVETQRLERIDIQRRSAYIVESDALFFKEQRGEIPAGTWAAKVAEIKAKFPKV